MFTETLQASARQNFDVPALYRQYDWRQIKAWVLTFHFNFLVPLHAALRTCVRSNSI